MVIEEKKLNYLVYLLSIYITFKILIFTLGDKTLNFHNHYISVGSLFIPLWFFIGDILTEVYGFPLVKKVIFVALICQFIFALICFSTTFLPSTQDNINTAYNLIFLRMPRLAFSSLLALASGAIMNAYLLDRWKKIVQGKYFLIRSLSTTILGETIFSFIAITSQFIGKTTFNHILELMIASILIKLIMTLVFVYPISLIANFIKSSFNIKNEQFPPQPLELINDV